MIIIIHSILPDVPVLRLIVTQANKHPKLVICEAKWGDTDRIKISVMQIFREARFAYLREWHLQVIIDRQVMT